MSFIVFFFLDDPFSLPIAKKICFGILNLLFREQTCTYPFIFQACTHGRANVQVEVLQH